MGRQGLEKINITSSHQCTHLFSVPVFLWLNVSSSSKSFSCILGVTCLGHSLCRIHIVSCIVCSRVGHWAAPYIIIIIIILSTVMINLGYKFFQVVCISGSLLLLVGWKHATHYFQQTLPKSPGLIRLSHVINHYDEPLSRSFLHTKSIPFHLVHLIALEKLISNEQEAFSCQ